MGYYIYLRKSRKDEELEKRIWRYPYPAQEGASFSGKENESDRNRDF